MPQPVPVDQKHRNWPPLRRGTATTEAVAAVVSKAAGGQQHGPRGHGAGVVVAALGLVPGVALLAVVAGAGVADALDAFADHAGVKHVGGGRILEAGPGLGVVRERNQRALGLGVVADDQGAFVVEGVDALNALVRDQVGW